MSEFAEITLDGCCSEGGGARGLVQAGHYVVGVDIDKTCREGYLRSGAHEFVHASVLDVLQDTSFMSRFTFTTQHPPCQDYSGMSACRPELRGRYPRLIRPIYAMLETFCPELPYVIENVWGARAELPDPVVMCMWMFGRKTYRHRVLWPGGGLVLTPPLPPYSGSMDDFLQPRVSLECGWPHRVPTARAGHWEPGKFVSVAGHERKVPVLEVMEIDWMSNRDRIKEAIPPYLGYWIAEQLAAWRAAQAATALRSYRLAGTA
jgi:DNA (cytosine-5)-methyltransferase 1